MRKEVEKTFEKREFNAEIITNLNIVKNSRALGKCGKLWDKNNYARGLDFDETIKCL